MDHVPQHLRGVEGALPRRDHVLLGEDAVPYGKTEHALAATHTMGVEGAIPVFSHRPYNPPTLPFAQRPLCTGTRRDGLPCKAKSRDGGSCCEAHLEQE